MTSIETMQNNAWEAFAALSTNELPKWAHPAPWMMGPKRDVGWVPPPPADPISLTGEQLDAFIYPFLTPPSSPDYMADAFGLEFTPDPTTYGNGYDELMEDKLAVIRDVKDEALNFLSERSAPAPLVENGGAIVHYDHTSSGLPDETPFIYLPPMDSLPSCEFTFAYSPPTTSGRSSSVSTSSDSQFDDSYPSTPHDSGSTVGSIEVGEEHSLFYNYTYASPPPPSTSSNSKKRAFDVVDEYYSESEGGNNDDDDDYRPECVCPARSMQKSNSPVKARNSRSKRAHQSPAHPRATTKRAKIADAELICRVNGCRHRALSSSECFKHRETHFAPRFHCPAPNCKLGFRRNSSLARHFVRANGAECLRAAGPKASWGPNLKRFETHPPEWLVPGFLDPL